MKNIKMSVNKEKTKLTIEIDLTETHGPSSSGKTTIVASTQGNKNIEGTDVYVGVNCYKK